MSVNETRRQELYQLLGLLPPKTRQISAEIVSADEHEHYFLEKIILDINGFESVPAYFTKPKTNETKNPTILFNHSHGGNYLLGKEELIKGNVYLQNPPYAESLAKQGYSALAIDSWCFGERHNKTESELFKEMLWSGRVMWGMMVYDSLRAIDYLVSREDVDSQRIGTVGMSMGSTMAWWIAALDTRIKVCVDLCCLTDFHELIESRGLDGHGIYYYVPNLLNSFTTSEINALISPRPHLGLAGNYDKLTPIKGLDKIDKELSEVYLKDGVPQAWKLLRFNCGHEETEDMRQEVLSFFQKWL